MNVNRARPVAAFILVSLLCAVVMVEGMRASAFNGVVSASTPQQTPRVVLGSVLAAKPGSGLLDRAGDLFFDLTGVLVGPPAASPVLATTPSQPSPTGPVPTATPASGPTGDGRPTGTTVKPQGTTPGFIWTFPQPQQAAAGSVDGRDDESTGPGKGHGQGHGKGKGAKGDRPGRGNANGHDKAEGRDDRPGGGDQGKGKAKGR